MAKQNKPSLGTTIRQNSSGVLAALMCIVIGLVIGLIALFIINPEHALVDGFWRILQGGFYDFPYGCGKVLTQTAPLIMTGLSVAFAFKTGLFNIGAAGQYTLGAFGALYFAIVLGMPWWVCLLVSAVFGALWGAIPGIFKAYLNINEVITSIMFNWIGLYLVNEIIYGRGSGVMYDAHNTRTWKLATSAPQAQIPSCGMSELFHTSNTTIAIFLAIIVAIVVWVVLEKTTFGYELKAVGLNKNAARYAGINEKKNVILSMTIAGALAGFGAGLFYLSGGGEWNPLNSTSLPAMGFNGIATALLANSNPIGTIFSSLFISHISVGGAYLPTKYFPSEIADLISGIIIYLCAFSMLFRTSCGMSELFHTSNTTIAIFLAIIVAIVVWVVLEKTTFGYELKAVGLNKNAARYAGINEKKNVILSMTIAGALAGFGAGLFYLSGGGEWNPLNSTSLPAMGFNGIATALLANSNPIGTIFSSLFISHISVGGAYLPTKYFPSEIADLISGIIIYLCAFSMLFRTLFERKLIHKKDTANANAEPAAKAVTKPEKEGK